MSADPAVLISATGLGLRFGSKQVLSGIDLSLRQGQILTLIGPNGAGKSSLVRLVLGLVRPTQGKLWVKPGIRIGYMPQRLRLDANLPLSARCFLGLATDDCAAIEQSAAELGVSHLLGRQMTALSGGETQRVLLARALVRRPELLVLDEPVQGVDVSGQVELYNFITQVRDRLGCAVLMISHDLHLVMAATDLVLCINQHLCCSGHPEAISQHPAFLRLLGPSALGKGLAVYSHEHRRDGLEVGLPQPFSKKNADG